MLQRRRKRVPSRRPSRRAAILPANSPPAAIASSCRAPWDENTHSLAPRTLPNLCVWCNPLSFSISKVRPRRVIAGTYDGRGRTGFRQTHVSEQVSRPRQQLNGVFERVGVCTVTMIRVGAFRNYSRCSYFSEANPCDSGKCAFGSHQIPNAVSIRIDQGVDGRVSHMSR